MSQHLRSIAFLDLLPGSAVLAGRTTGTAVDLAGYIGPAQHEMGAILNVTALSAITNGSVAVTIQENTTSAIADTGWAACTSTGTFSAITTQVLTGNASQVIFFTATGRYVRALVVLGTGAATTTSAGVTCQVFLPARYASSAGAANTMT